jgi:hypothetical protein
MKNKVFFMFREILLQSILLQIEKILVFFELLSRLKMIALREILLSNIE